VKKRGKLACDVEGQKNVFEITLTVVKKNTYKGFT